MKKAILLAWMVVQLGVRPVNAADPWPGSAGTIRLDIRTHVVTTEEANYPLGVFKINSSSSLDTLSGSSQLFLLLSGVDDPLIFTQMIGAEPDLGNPPMDGWVLSGSPNGGRAWVPQNTAGGVTSISVTNGHGVGATVTEASRQPNIAFDKLTNIDPDNVTLPAGGRITGTVSSYPNTDLTNATLDWSQSNKFQRKYTGSTTMVFINRVNGQTIRIKQQQTSGTLSWPAAVVAPTPAAPSGNEDIYECEDWNGSVNCRQLAANFTVGATPSPTVSPSPTPVPTPTPTPTLTPTPTPTPTPIAAPIITVQPANKTVTAGQTASFTVTATGAPTLAYQWKKNGASITGATARTYVTPATTVAGYNGSTYSVVVTNPGGSVTSANATLTVNAAPTPTPTPGHTPTPTPTATATPVPAVAPVFNPANASGGNGHSPITVTISTTTSGAQMRYTTNGTTPSSGPSGNGTLINGTSGTAVIPTDTFVVLKAITFKTGIPNSAVTTASYDNTFECCETGHEACCSF